MFYQFCLPTFLSLCLFVSLNAVNAQTQPTEKQSNADRRKTEKIIDEEEILRVETNLVIVSASVSDKSGRFISNLKRENFRLSEDGITQEIEFFEGNDAPFTVALLIDLSESTKGSFADIQKSAAAFIEQLSPNDKVILIPFNKYIYQRTEATGDRELLKKEISEMVQGGGTSVYDALEFVYEKLDAIRGRKAVVLFSDGVDTTSRATYQETLRAAQRLDALIYTINYETMNAATKDTISKYPVEFPLHVVTAKGENLKTAYARGSVYLKFLADNSGGRFFLADSPENLVKTFQSIADELRRQYSVGYYPKNDASGDKSRKIKVGVDVPNSIVKARKSYLYKGAAKS
ncbi:MAG: VWA domain-containing protein [Pyrinomonadaceae bacterium]|nr:VWA domain-containing protein [Pyrinomonadaceae bacterium]